MHRPIMRVWFHMGGVFEYGNCILNEVTILKTEHISSAEYSATELEADDLDENMKFRLLTVLYWGIQLQGCLGDV